MIRLSFCPDRLNGPAIVLVLLVLCGLAAAATLEERVVEHTMANGLTLLVMERHHAPIVSVNLTYKVGSVNEHAGITGVAHLYEHMAFKGTRTIGVTDAEKERPVLEELDRIAEALAEESAKGAAADQKRVAALREELNKVSAQADRFVVASELAALYQRNGGVGLNATTGKDLTRYFLSLPANRLPLWAAVESNRMGDVVLREFYKEKNIVLEERRQRTDNSPSGRLYESFTASAFQAHPYGLPVIGWPSDVSALTRSRTEAFFQTYYGPANAVISIVGDVNAKDTIALIERTFGRIPPRAASPGVRTTEPQQQARSSGWAGCKAVAAAACGTGVSAFSDFPGAQYSNLFVISAMPRAPHTAAEVEQAVYEELERLKREPVTARELEKILNQLDAGLVRSLRSNSGMASRLAYYQAVRGDWRELIRRRDRIAKVTQDDIQRVAKTYLIKSNRTVATLVKPSTQPAQVQP